MAGHYFYDPRPFYGHTGYTGLVPLDELFYGRYEPIPYWMDQRMMPFEENYYPGQKQNMGSRRAGAEVRQQQSIPQQGENNFMTYKRPELVRDDMYADMYRRSPYNFNYSYGRDGVAVMPMHPETMRRGQSQDDTWVHSMRAPVSSGYGQAYRGLPEPPPGAMTTHFGNGNGNEQYRNMHHGSDQYRQTDIPLTMSKQSNIYNHGNNHGNSHGNSLGNSHGNSQGNSHGNSHGNNQGISHGNSHGNNHGTKQMGGSGNQNGNVGKSVANTTSLKRTSSNIAKHYDSSSSSDSDDDDDSHERGQRSSVKSQHGYNSQAYQSKISSHSPSSKPSSKKTSTQNGCGGASKLNNQSKISKLLGFRDGGSDDSSSSEDESYGSSKKRSSNNGNNTHGSNFQTQYASQPKHSQQQGSSQSKSVELKVPICCDNCERKVRSCLEKMHGVEYVLCDQWKRKVVVSGKVKADDVLKRVRRVKKSSELWEQAKLPQTQTQQTQQQPQQQRRQQGLY